MNIDLNIELSKWQRKVFDVLNLFRFIIISAGRQSGKTFFCVFIIILKALLNPGWICWWVAPTYPISRIAMRRVVKFLADSKMPYSLNKSELRIEFANGSTIWFKSADNEDGLRGETVSFLVIDEMGFIKHDTWTFALRGTITATQAQVIFIGTPKGRNLFYQLYCKGQDKEDKDYTSFQFTSQESPFFSEEEWVEVQRLPQRVFEQEYLAQFLDDGGEVFRNVRDCINGDLQKAHHKKYYYAGVDLAKSYDYTVVCILDQDGHLVAFDRFNDISWNIQKDRITKLCKEYNAVICMDSTGLGDPLVEDLQFAGFPVEGFKFTNTTKRQIIENLAMGIERQEVTFPEIPELINELNIFTFEQLPSGMIRYAAPSGMHDDIVISLALAYHKQGGNRYISSDSYGSSGERVTSEMDF